MHRCRQIRDIWRPEKVRKHFRSDLNQSFGAGFVGELLLLEDRVYASHYMSMTIRRRD
jgi:hypothetical protein